jgi:glycosyltransferase involved in cell wall biosynthesis
VRRVLIITYYWPPSGGSAVLRWLKFAKYLRQYGWEPVIYTPENPEPQETDTSLLNDIAEGLTVLRTRIMEPYALYKKFTGRKKTDRLGVGMMADRKSKSVASRISLWIRSNLFIPDPRMLWIRPSVKYLRRYLAGNPAEAIITTGPPHSMHLIGRKLKAATGLPWLADFRDPWTNIDFYRELRLTRFADRLHRKLEKSVLLNADRVVTVSNGMTQEFRQAGARQVFTLTNGYDDEINPAVSRDPLPNGKFTLLHLGSVPFSRNPECLWKALSEILPAYPEFARQLELKLVGKVDPGVSDAIEQHGLRDWVTYVPYVEHKLTQQVMQSASVLLLLINNTPNARGILTNKFFEYLSSGKPILGIGPVDGDAADILKDTGAGPMVEHGDIQGATVALLQLFESHSQGKLTSASRNITKYARISLTAELAGILNTLSP